MATNEGKEGEGFLHVVNEEKTGQFSIILDFDVSVNGFINKT